MRFAQVFCTYVVMVCSNVMFTLWANVENPFERSQMPCMPLKQVSPISIQGCQRCMWTVMSGVYEPVLECRCVGDNILRMDRLFIREVLAKCLGTIAFVDGALACQPKSAERTID